MTASRAPKPSYVQIPDPAPPVETVLDFLTIRFKKVPRDIWAERLKSGAMTDDKGGRLEPDTPCRARLRLRYFREVQNEPQVPFEEKIIFQDGLILVADKPHFLPVHPAGSYVNECLVYRLRKRTGNPNLVPVNRLDRETAGLVLFSADPASRSKYYRLFAKRQVRKGYEVLARLPPDADSREEWIVETRIEKITPWFLSANVEGAPNSRTVIRLVERQGEYGRFLAEPVTGRNHQIRLHFAYIGSGIINDGLYPLLSEGPKQGYDFPLQLLAKDLAFRDPVTGLEREFQSQRRLEHSG